MLIPVCSFLLQGLRAGPMSVHTNPMWSSAAGQMCHTVPAAEQSWGTHSFSSVVPVCSIA